MVKETVTNILRIDHKFLDSGCKNVAVADMPTSACHVYQSYQSSGCVPTLTALKTDNWWQCSRTCDNNSKCTSWDFELPGRECTLNSGQYAHRWDVKHRSGFTGCKVRTTTTTSTSKSTTTTSSTTTSNSSKPISSGSEKIITLKELKAMKPAVGSDGLRTYSFDHFVFHPPSSFGLISLESSYRKIFPQEGGTDVAVDLAVLGVSSIDSLEKIVGLKILLQLAWEDERIVWGVEGYEGPNVGEEWEFNSKILE